MIFTIPEKILKARGAGYIKKDLIEKESLSTFQDIYIILNQVEFCGSKPTAI